MEVEDILNYVMDTPGNTNPNILKPMLSQLKGGSDGDILFITSHYEGREYLVLDATWQEIHDAALCVITLSDMKKLVCGTSIDDGIYLVKVASFDSNVPYEFYQAIVPDGQPKMQL